MSAQKANNTIERVRELQRKLYLAAKSDSKRRFHALYDKVYRKDILSEAWKRVKANGGAGGVDKVTIADVERQGIEGFLQEIQQELMEGRYHPKAVRRMYIPKGNDEQRPLGLPIIKDRVVQMAVKIVIEPLFEADFKDCSYGFRPKRNAHQALDRIRKDTANKGWWVVDADIRGYFNNINHEKLMLDMPNMIEILNPKVIGMRNDYSLKNAGKQLNKIDWYIIKKFTLWYNYKTGNKRRYSGISKVRGMIYDNEM
ncbi:MAG TPA: reverse transcriptase domain-containing protein [Ruminiclostridium sp.]|nr:reverse transcriptase domain-containing protein [Ruminiclostridium sp.]